MSINTDRLVRIVSRMPGVAREVRKNLGDPVRAGEVMAVIDSRELADAKGAYLAATERAALTADTFQREKDLWERKSLPLKITSKPSKRMPKRALKCALPSKSSWLSGFLSQR